MYSHAEDDRKAVERGSNVNTETQGITRVEKRKVYVGSPYPYDEDRILFVVYQEGREAPMQIGYETRETADMCVDAYTRLIYPGKKFYIAEATAAECAALIDKYGKKS